MRSLKGNMFNICRVSSPRRYFLNKYTVQITPTRSPIPVETDTVAICAVLIFLSEIVGLSFSCTSLTIYDLPMLLHLFALLHIFRNTLYLVREFNFGRVVLFSVASVLYSKVGVCPLRKRWRLQKTLYLPGVPRHEETSAN